MTEDARHWLASMSLLEGHYRDLTHPARPPLGYPLPGYPLLLLPAAALGSVRLGQWMNVAMALGCVLLAVRMLRREPRAALAAAALAALNPLSVIHAAPLMTDTAFYFFAMAALAATAELLDAFPPGAEPRKGEKRSRWLYASAVLGGLCAWMRPQGAVVLAACGLVLLEGAATRRLLPRWAAAAAPLAAAPYLFILARAGAGGTYFGEVPAAAATSGSLAAEQLRVLWINAKFYAWAATTKTLLSWVHPLPGEESPAAAAAAAALGLWLLRETARALREPGAPKLAATYVAVYLGLHLFWVNQFRRYLFPLLPFLYWLALRRLERRPRALAAAAGSLLALFLVIDALLVRQSFVARPLENRPPEGTLEWIRRSTRPEDVLAGRYKEMFRWHTGRAMLDLVTIPDPDDWFHRLASHRVRFVVEHPEGETFETIRQERFQANVRLAARRLADPRRFKPVFRAPGEPFLIYELLDGERFERGYAALIDARAAIERGELAAARRSLEEARASGAALTRLPFYLGTTELLLGERRRARRWLEEALRLEPDFAPARRNLERSAAPSAEERPARAPRAP